MQSIVCESLFSLLQFAIPWDMFSRVFAIWSCPFGRLFCQFLIQFQPTHIHHSYSFRFLINNWSARISKSLNQVKRLIKNLKEYEWWMCVGWNWIKNWQNKRPKGQDQMAKTLENISQGIANCNRLNRDSQTIDCNI